LFAILLNTVMPCNARFTSESGKKTRKAKISVSQESMVLRHTRLNDYERKIIEITSKFYSEGRTIQPWKGWTTELLKGSMYTLIKN